MIPLAITNSLPVTSAKIGDVVAYLSCCRQRAVLRIGIINGIRSKARYWDKEKEDIQMCTTLPSVSFRWTGKEYNYTATLRGAHILNPKIVAVLDPSEILDYDKFVANMANAHMSSRETHLPALHAKMSARYHKLNP